MKITIELERADMTPEASAALVSFLAAIPAAPEKATPKRRVPKLKVVETPPATEAGDDPLATPTAPPAAPPAAPVASPAAPAPTAAPTAPVAAAVVPAAAPAADLDGLRTALREYAAINGREAAIEVLKEAGGAISVSAIDPAKIPAVIAALA